MDQPEFAKFWAADAKKMEDAINSIGRVQGLGWILPEVGSTACISCFGACARAEQTRSGRFTGGKQGKVGS